MRRRSLAGPLLLVLIGAFFLWRNVYPEAPVFDLVSTYWPFLLIAWGFVRLIEVVVMRDSRYPGLTGGEIVLVVLISMAGLGMFEVHQHGVQLTPNIFGEEFDYPISEHASAAGVKRVVFDNPRGSLRITGGDAQEITVTGRKLIRAYARRDADRTNGGTSIELSQEGDRLFVRSRQDRAPGDQRIANDLEVTLPRGMAIEARGQNGDFDITDTGEVDLASSRGDVRLLRVGGNVKLEIGRSNVIHAEDIKGSLDLRGSGSDVDFQNVAGQVTIDGAYLGSLQFKSLAKPLRFEGTRSTEVRVEAVPGAISMDLGDFTAKNVVGPVRLVTQSRDIRLEDFTESLDLETQRGDVELDPGHVPLPKIEAHSVVGRIDLVLPEKAAFQLQATADGGEATNDFGPSIQKQVTGATATLKGSVGEGPMIRITADHGSVSVRKQGTAASDRGPEPPHPPAPPAPPQAPAAPKLPGEVKL
ncbi:MAG TPA: DUF4097 family beta strand repeat-containing protein [Bryobacteraceae bacterium]|nr:DUF4097 family beta strand repeat-containing protein [Bryobacteraceae bacterium]